MTDSSYDLDRVRTVFDDWALRGRAQGMEQSHGPFARQAFDRLGLRVDGGGSEGSRGRR